MSYGSTRRQKYLGHTPVRIHGKNQTGLQCHAERELVRSCERVTGVVVTNNVTGNDAPSHSIKASGHGARPECDNIHLVSPCRSPIHPGLRHTRPLFKTQCLTVLLYQARSLCSV